MLHIPNMPCHIWNCSSVEELLAEMKNIIELIKNEKPEIINLFSKWINNFLETKKTINDDEKETVVNEIKDIMGVKTMFETAVRQRDERMIEQGELHEKQEVLIRQTAKKFGISDADKQFIQSVTDFTKLDNALDVIIFAETLEEILSALK